MAFLKNQKQSLYFFKNDILLYTFFVYTVESNIMIRYQLIDNTWGM